VGLGFERKGKGKGIGDGIGELSVEMVSDKEVVGGL